MKEEENKETPPPAVTQEPGRTLDGEVQRERDSSKS